MGETVQAWLDRQDADARAGVERLREAVRSIPADWDETIKWNAPSFAVDGRDRVTLGLERKGGWRVVLHRGAAAAPAPAFAFVDVTGLARWPSPDRGVVQFRSLEEIAASRERLIELIAGWIAAC